MLNIDLSGRVALVTGGNSGIGLGIARGLGKAGASLVVLGRNQAKLDVACSELASLPCQVHGIAVDICGDGMADDVVQKVVDRFGRLDILVHCAGVTARKRPEDLTDSDWRLVNGTNLDAAFKLIRAAYPHLKKSGAGRIINIGSMLSLFGSPWGAAYAASKGAIVQYSRSLATAWAKDGITVNCLLPGWINTDLTASARTEVPGLNEKVLAGTPVGRWGATKDLEGIAAFLSSDAASFITGTAIPVDGGYSVQV